MPICKHCKTETKRADRCKSCSNKFREKKGRGMLGKSHNEKTRKKISKALTGKKKSPEHAAKIRTMNIGRKASDEVKLKLSLIHHERQGGQYRKKTKYGYILCFEPTHPNRNSGSRVFEHRLVMEKKIGRFLKKTEQVHHINKVKDDNRPENLFLVTSSKEHRSMEITALDCPHCKKTINLNI